MIDITELERKLIAAARAHPPSDQVPYTFEKRVLALLSARPVLDPRAAWARALWRSAAACLSVVVLVGAFSLFLPRPGGSSNDLSQDFESTMLAAADQETDYSW